MRAMGSVRSGVNDATVTADANSASRITDAMGAIGRPVSSIWPKRRLRSSKQCSQGIKPVVRGRIGAQGLRCNRSDPQTDAGSSHAKRNTRAHV